MRNRGLKVCPFGGKTCYPTIKRAKIVRNTLGKFKNVNSLRIYKCPNCHYFHFTRVKD